MTNRTKHGYEWVVCHCTGKDGGLCRSVLSMGHRWNPRTLVCTGRGCKATWDSHQLDPAECEKKPTYRDGPAKRQRVSLREYRRCCLTHMCIAGWTVREIKASLPIARSTIERDLEDRGVKPARDNYRGGNPRASKRAS